METVIFSLHESQKYFNISFWSEREREREYVKREYVKRREISRAGRQKFSTSKGLFVADKTHFLQLKTPDFLFTLYYSTIGIRGNRMGLLED